VECRSGGGRVRVRAGEVVEEGAAIPVPGTVIEVRDLFANTPARLKFLKSEATESAACVKTVQAYAVLYPEVRFELTVEGRSALRTSGDGDARAAASAVHGASVAAELALFADVQRAERAGLTGSAPYRLAAPAAAGAAAREWHTPRLHEVPAAVPAALPAPPAPVAALEGPLRPLGQVMEGYLVAEG